MYFHSFTVVDWIESEKGVVLIRVGGSAEDDFVVMFLGKPFFQSNSYDDCLDAMLSMYNRKNGHDVVVPENYALHHSGGNCPISLKNPDVPSGTNLRDSGSSYIQVGYRGQPSFIKYERIGGGREMAVAESEYFGELVS
jgi:hypothetical protein